MEVKNPEAKGRARMYAPQKETGRQRAFRMANEPPAAAPPGLDISGLLAEQEAAMAAQRQAFMEQMAELERQSQIRERLADLNSQRMAARGGLSDLAVSEYQARLRLEEAKKQAAQAEAAKVTGGGRGTVDLKPFETEYANALKALEEARGQIQSLQGTILGEAGQLGEADYYQNLFSQETEFDPESYIKEMRTNRDQTKPASQERLPASPPPTFQGRSADNILAGVFSGSSGLDESGQRATNRIF